MGGANKGAAISAVIAVAILLVAGVLVLWPQSKPDDLQNPIVVVGNEAFENLDIVSSGNGSTDNPFIIENQRIRSAKVQYSNQYGGYGYVAGMTIQSVTRHAILRNLIIDIPRYGDGIWLSGCRDFVMENVSYKGWGIGIGIESCENITVTGCSIESANSDGVSTSKSVEISIERNNIICGAGPSFTSVVSISDCHQVSVSNNTLAGEGILVDGSTYCDIVGNRLSGNGAGLSVRSSIGCAVSGNDLDDFGLDISGTEEVHFYSHTIASNNTLNGRPILVYRDAANITLAQVEIGQVLAFNVTGISASLLLIDHAGYGFVLRDTRQIDISNCTIGCASTGIALYGCSIIAIGNNTISTLNTGIHQQSCNGSRIWENVITGPPRHYGFGVELDSCTNTTTYHNDFVNLRGSDNNPTMNSWDAGYPSGGNYWTYYSGTDKYSQPSQNIPSPDGIGDQSFKVAYFPSWGYSSSDYATDDFPLIRPQRYVLPPMEEETKSYGGLIVGIAIVCVFVLLIVLVAAARSKGWLDDEGGGPD